MRVNINYINHYFSSEIFIIFDLFFEILSHLCHKSKYNNILYLKSTHSADAKQGTGPPILYLHRPLKTRCNVNSCWLMNIMMLVTEILASTEGSDCSGSSVCMRKYMGKLKLNRLKLMLLQTGHPQEQDILNITIPKYSRYSCIMLHIQHLCTKHDPH